MILVNIEHKLYICTNKATKILSSWSVQSHWHRRKNHYKYGNYNGQQREILLLLSHFSSVWFCATPSLGFSRKEHWSGLPLPSPMHKTEKWKWSHSVMSDSSRPHGLQPTRLLRPWDFPGKSTGVGCHCFLW